MERNQPISGEFYRHFKGELYQIKMLAMDSESQEWMVVYQGMYPPFQCWVRKLDEFMEPVDGEKYPGCSQGYRFEKVERQELEKRPSDDLEISQENDDKKIGHFQEQKTKWNKVTKEFFRKAIMSGQPERYLKDVMTDEQVAERGFLELLDAESFREKRQIFLGLRNYLTPLLISNIAVAMDIVLEGGDKEEQYESVLRCLDTFEHYEGGRLR